MIIVEVMEQKCIDTVMWPSRKKGKRQDPQSGNSTGAVGKKAQGEAQKQTDCVQETTNKCGLQLEFVEDRYKWKNMIKEFLKIPCVYLMYNIIFTMF